MTANNVVQFPGVKRNTPPQTMDEVFDVIQKARLDHINIIVEYTLEYLANRFMEEGFDVAKPECDKSMYLVEEALRGALCTSVAIYHPLTDLADELFDEKPDE